MTSLPIFAPSTTSSKAHRLMASSNGQRRSSPWQLILPGALAAPTAPLANFTLCTYVTDTFLTRAAFAAKHAVEFNTRPSAPDVAGVSLVTAAEAPALFPSAAAPSVSIKSFTWNVTFLAFDGWRSIKNYLRPWVLHGHRCDALLAPGYSYLVAAMSPLIEPTDVAWVDAYATAAALGDKSIHPAFSRVVPTSENNGATFARIALSFGWTGVNTICIDTSYPRAVIRGFEKAFREGNGTVHVSRCLSDALTEETFAETMQMIERTSPSRVLVISAVSHSKALTTAHLLHKKYDKKFIILMVDICLNTIPDYFELESVLCLTDSYDYDRTAPFRASYTTRNTTDDQAIADALPNWQGRGTDLSEFTDALPYGHDAALHAMRALALRHALPSVNYTTAVRSLMTEGLTGTIRLNPNTGDRPNAVRRLFNTRGGHHVVVGRVPPGGDLVFVDADGNPTENAGKKPPPLVLLGGLTDTIPSGFHPAREASSGSVDLMVVVGVVVAGVVVLAAVAVIVAFWCFRFAARDNSNAPKDSTKPFAIVFTDIQASTALWARVPEQMSEAVDVHHATIRRLIARHHGYEVKTIGDSFMVAFHDAKAAVGFSVDTQQQLFKEEWPRGIDDTYGTVFELDSRPQLWNGLRVRVGGHYGLGKIQQDPVTQGFDYYGTVVNTAARVEAVGHGGQTLVTSSVVEALHNDGTNLAGAVVNDLGRQSLRGLADPVWLYEMNPSAFAQRAFPPLRLDVEVDDAERDDAPSRASDDADGSRLSVTHDTIENPSQRTGSTSEPGGHAARRDAVVAEISRLAAAVAKRRRRTRARSPETPAGVTPTGPSPTEPHQSTRMLMPLEVDTGMVPTLPGQPPEPCTVPCGDGALLDSRRGSRHHRSPPLDCAPPPDARHYGNMTDFDASNNKESNRADGDRDQQDIVLLASFLRKLLSVVPAKERQRAVAQYAKRWHAKVTTAQDVRSKKKSAADAKYCADVSSARTTMALVERVWLALDVL